MWLAEGYALASYAAPNLTFPCESNEQLDDTLSSAPSFLLFLRFTDPDSCLPNEICLAQTPDATKLYWADLEAFTVCRDLEGVMSMPTPDGLCIEKSLENEGPSVINRTYSLVLQAGSLQVDGVTYGPEEFRGEVYVIS
jgi:hypothetical protein